MHRLQPGPTSRPPRGGEFIEAERHPLRRHPIAGLALLAGASSSRRSRRERTGRLRRVSPSSRGRVHRGYVARRRTYGWDFKSRPPRGGEFIEAGYLRRIRYAASRSRPPRGGEFIEARQSVTSAHRVRLALLAGASSSRLVTPRRVQATEVSLALLAGASSSRHSKTGEPNGVVESRPPRGGEFIEARHQRRSRSLLAPSRPPRGGEFIEAERHPLRRHPIAGLALLAGASSSRRSRRERTGRLRRVSPSSRGRVHRGYVARRRTYGWDFKSRPPRGGEFIEAGYLRRIRYAASRSRPPRGGEFIEARQSVTSAHRVRLALLAGASSSRLVTPRRVQATEVSLALLAGASSSRHSKTGEPNGVVESRPPRGGEFIEARHQRRSRSLLAPSRPPRGGEFIEARGERSPGTRAV